MGQHPPIPRHELEESAEGTVFYRTPGGDLQVDDARDEAEASGWLPADVMFDWPSVDTQRQIANRRQDLYTAMRRLEASIARASRNGDWVDEVRRALDRLRSELHRHIAEIEEPDGLFVEVIDQAPHLTSIVVELRRDHQDLLEACERALEMTSTPGEVDIAGVRRKVLGILGRLAIHRQQGAELLFDAYNVDLAAAD